MLVEVAPAVAKGGWAPVAIARPSLRRRIAAAAPPYLYLLPALVGVVVWTYLPLVETVRLSFFEWDLVPTTPKLAVGLDQYGDVLTLPELGKAAVNTVVQIAGLLVFAVVLPVVAAIAVRSVRGRAHGVYRAAIFAPFLVAPVAAAVLWRWLLAPDGGLVNAAIEGLGGGAVNWLREPMPALIAVIVIAGWKLLGFAFLVISAGMAGINDDYHDAAAVDGATRWQATRLVTLPLLSPTVMFMTLMTVIVAAQWVFPLLDALTQGGPANATTNIYYLLYQQGFSNFDVGVASAAGVLFFCVFVGVAALGVWLMDRFSFHDD